jgi:hypothetical protein
LLPREHSCEVLFEQDNEEVSVPTLILDAILKVISTLILDAILKVISTLILYAILKVISTLILDAILKVISTLILDAILKVIIISSCHSYKIVKTLRYKTFIEGCCYQGSY